MKNRNIILATLMSLMLPQLSMAQDADLMNSNGKIYVVVGVLAIIFIGIIFFLIYLERKVAKLEQEDFEDL